MRAVPGVTQAEGDISGAAVIVGSDGDPLGNEQGAPRFGQNVYGGELSPWVLAEGRLPGPDELVVDMGSFKKGDFALGDQVSVSSQGGSRQFPLVGVVKFGDVDSPGGATFALFDTATAESFVGQPGMVDNIVAKGDGSISEEELAARVQQAMPEGVEVLTGEQITEENQSDIQQSLSFFNILLLVFAGVALFVGSFIIYNTFSIIVAQRQKENALLRAIGASRGQILGSLLIESVIIGFVASLLGIALGVLTAKLLEVAAQPVRRRHPVERPGAAPPHDHRVAHRRDGHHGVLRGDAGRPRLEGAPGGRHARRRARHVGEVEDPVDLGPGRHAARRARCSWSG